MCPPAILPSGRSVSTQNLLTGTSKNSNGKEIGGKDKATNEASALDSHQGLMVNLIPSIRKIRKASPLRRPDQSSGLVFRTSTGTDRARPYLIP